MAETRRVNRALDAAWARQAASSTRWSLKKQWPLVGACAIAIFLTPLMAQLIGGDPLSWRLTAGALGLSAAFGLLLPIFAIAVHLGWFCGAALVGRAVLFVSEDADGWGCVTARKQLGRDGTWSVQNLLAIPEGSMNGALAARALIRWADDHRLTLTSVPRDDRLSEQYTKPSVGFRVVARTRTGKPCLTREPRPLR